MQRRLANLFGTGWESSSSGQLQQRCSRVLNWKNMAGETVTVCLWRRGVGYPPQAQACLTLSPPSPSPISSSAFSAPPLPKRFRTTNSLLYFQKRNI